MIPVTTRKGQKLALFGLGGSGMVTARALLAGGADVIAFDDNPASAEIAKSEGIPVRDLREVDFTTLDGLVLAPGVPLTHPHPHWSVDLASRAGIEIVGDVGLFAQERRAVAPDCAFVAITGTNGKSTTTALISHILREAGKDVQMGGNIGKAVLSLEPFADGRIYVVECSSYQIDLAPGLDPSIGILLNLAPDHLDRHGTMENYAAIKARLVAGSKQAVIGIDDTYCRNIERKLAETGTTPPMQISVKAETGNGYYFKDGCIFPVKQGATGFSLQDAPTLRGIHNAQNALAAVATCNLLGVDAQPGLKTFPGLAHRMEILGNVGKTVYVNDSKGTNADAAAMALGSFENIYWIAGGLPKEGGIENLRDYFPRIRKAFLIGEAAGQFAATLGDGVRYEISGDLASAVLSAASETLGAEAVVLLSPACASFDQFRNFEARGEAFREAVARLEGFVAFGGTPE